jgi:CubicO group peptidase (beta-lactamase class C family)
MRDLASGTSAAADGHFRIGSVTKTFVATVLLQLTDEGRLALDDPIERHLPGVVPDGERITVRHVLQHTSVPGHRPSLPTPHAHGYEQLPTTPPTIVDAN